MSVIQATPSGATLAMKPKTVGKTRKYAKAMPTKEQEDARSDQWQVPAVFSWA
jgi:hypothetical protein